MDQHTFLWIAGMVIALLCAYFHLAQQRLEEKIAGVLKEIEALRKWRHDLEDARSGYLAAEFMKGKR